MSATRLGRLLFAVGLAVLGLLNLVWGEFSYVWQPVPKWVAWRGPLATASGVVLVALGLGMLWPRTARMAALLLTANMAAWLLLTEVPFLLAAPAIEVRWLACGETLMLLAGGWSLLAAAARGEQSRRGLLDGPRGARLARLVFALALPMVGLSHFVYLETTTSMVPAWLPCHVGFAYLTGAAHIAAGLGLLFGVLPRLAATAEAAMISLFTVAVNVPLAIGHPGDHFQVSDLFVAVALAGAAWAVAGSLAGAPWGLRSPRPQREPAGAFSPR